MQMELAIKGISKKMIFQSNTALILKMKNWVVIILVTMMLKIGFLVIIGLFLNLRFQPILPCRR